MNLELMQMRMNAIADKLEELSDMYTTRKNYLDRWQDESKYDMLTEFEELTFSITNIIRQEMKIEYY